MGRPEARLPPLFATALLSRAGERLLTGGLAPLPAAGLATRAAVQAIPLSVLRALRRPDTPPPR